MSIVGNSKYLYSFRLHTDAGVQPHEKIRRGEVRKKNVEEGVKGYHRGKTKVRLIAMLYKRYATALSLLLVRDRAAAEQYVLTG